jgi:hypothetical protein
MVTGVLKDHNAVIFRVKQGQWSVLDCLKLKFKTLAFFGKSVAANQHRGCNSKYTYFSKNAVRN